MVKLHNNWKLPFIFYVTKLLHKIIKKKKQQKIKKKYVQDTIFHTKPFRPDFKNNSKASKAAVKTKKKKALVNAVKCDKQAAGGVGLRLHCTVRIIP